MATVRRRNGFKKSLDSREPDKSRTRRRQPAAKSRFDPAGEGVLRKLVAFDLETWQALDLLARDTMTSFQELADEAFRDLLRKHGRPDTLRSALKRSAEAGDDTDGRSRRRAGAGSGRR
jgi:hypothetical protein